MVPGHSIFAQLHSASNAGHLVLETAIPILSLSSIFQEDISVSQILLRDTCDRPIDATSIGDSAVEKCEL